MGVVMVQTFAQGLRRALKPRQCFHCGRHIVRGEVYGYQTNKYDCVYTLAWHLDCEELAAEYRRLSAHDYDDEGWPGLREEWCNSGEYYDECDRWRGFYPHVVTRMELSDQLRNPKENDQ